MMLHEACAALDQDTLLSSMPPELREQLVNVAKVRAAPAGTIICRAGQPADRLIIPVDAGLRLTRGETPDTTAEVGHLSARRALNLGALLRQSVWDYTAVAHSDVNLFEVDGSTLLDLLRQSPEYSVYLQRITGVPSLRKAAQALRRAGLQPRAVQTLFYAFGQRTVFPGDVVSSESELLWVLVDQGTLALTQEEPGGTRQLAELTSGQYYGGGPILGHTVPLALRAVTPSTLFVIEPGDIQRLSRNEPTLALALREEHPEVEEALRDAFLETGAEFTAVMRAPTATPFADDTAVAGASSLAEPTQIISTLVLGRPWVPQPAKARRLGGVRCTLEEDSAAAALATVLNFTGRQGVLSTIRRTLRQRVPVSLLDIAELAERHGLLTQPAKLKRTSQLRDLDLPAMISVQQRFVVLFELHKRHARIFDPLHGFRDIPLTELEAQWSGAVLSFQDVRPFLRSVLPESSPQRAPGSRDQHSLSPTSTRTNWQKRLAYFRLISEARGTLLTMAMLAIAVMCLGVIAPRLTGLVVDDVLVQGDLSLLGVVTVGLLLVNLSTFVLSALRQLCLVHLAASLEHRLSSLTMRHTLGVGLSVHGENRVGTAISRMAELTRIRDSVSKDLLDIAFQLLQAVFFLALVFTYSPILGGLLLAAAPVGFAIVRIGGLRYRRLYLKLFDQSSRMQSELTEQIESVATIKAVGGAAAAQHRWESTLVDKIEVERSLIHTQIGVGGSLQLLQEMVRIAGLYIAVTMVLGEQLTPGMVLAVSMYMSGALGPLLGLASKLDELEQLGISFRKLDDLFEHPIEDEEHAVTTSSVQFNKGISVRGLSFQYDSGGPLILRNVSFELPAGTTVAIVGRSGSGKTTLARLLQGAVRATAGELFFDGHDVTSIPLATLRQNVSVVLQDSQLFAGTIESNIAYGDDRPDPRRVREAARLASAHDFITTLPAGYRTYLAEGGLGLSGGQRQRVCIARALYRNPRILIMDEATSALDAESERAIIGNMREILRARTAVVIAHRLSTVRDAQSILVLDEGRVVENGTHDDLMSQKGLYHSLFSQQQLQG